jgi:hypothetical protein
MMDSHTLSQKYSDLVLPNTVVEMSEAVFGIVGNLVVLLVYTKYIQDKTVTRYFIPVLAVVDLVGCLSNVIYFYLTNTMKFVFPNNYTCKTFLFLRIMTAGLSAHLILVIALQRYLLICRPLGEQFNRKYCKMCILFVFIFSLGYSAPMLKVVENHLDTFIIGNGTQNISISTCKIRSSASAPYFGTVFLVFLINIAVTIGLYIPITKTIYQKLSSSRRNRKPENVDQNIESEGGESTRMERVTQMEDIPSQDAKRASIDKPTASTKNGDHDKEKARIRFSVMFLIIIVVYIVSYLVTLAVHAQKSPSWMKQSNRYKINIYLFFARLNLLNHIANPYIYWFFDIKFRNELRRICCTDTCWRRS